MKRQPVYIVAQDSSGDGLFGWLHLPDEALSRDCVAVICGPIGYEYTHSHRTIRHLADRLALKGIPAIRFDFHGTGDSPGSDLDPERLSRWQKDIENATAFAIRTTGCKKVCLIGLRFGALLAARASAGLFPDFLVLWNPVISGKRYLRELRTLAAAATAAPAKVAEANALLDAGGFLMSPETARSLEQLDLLKFEVQAKRRALILHRDDLFQDPTLAEKMRAEGIEVDEKAYSGFSEMMAEPHFTKVPEGALDCMADWVFRDTQANSASGRFITEISPAHRFALAEEKVTLEERACHYGENGGLFGILSQASDSAPTDKPVIVFLNSGSVHHVGPNRIYVTLARKLALDGYTCFRTDACGLGDSVAPPSVRENHPYPESSQADTEQALRFLKEELGYRRFILLGLCSGAHTAFHGGIGLEAYDITEVMLINPLTYRWAEGMSLETNTRHFQEVAYYKHTMRDPKKWLKLLSGKVKVGKGVQVAFTQSMRIARDLLTFEEESPLSKDLAVLLERGRRMTLFISRQDPGFDILMAGAKKLVRRERESGKIRVRFIENADHTFSALGPRTDLIAQIRAELAFRAQ